MTGRARILRAGSAVAEPLLAPLPSPLQRARRVHRDDAEAKVQAARILERARAEAASIVDAARAQAAGEARVIAERVEAEAVTRAIAEWVAVRADEQRRIDRDADRVVSLATAMAERLLGEALGVARPRIGEIARVVLSEARGARRATIDVHPADAAELRTHLSSPGFEGFDTGVLSVREDASLGRGDLRVHTDRGSLDARVGLRLERLASAMRDALSHPEQPR